MKSYSKKTLIMGLLTTTALFTLSACGGGNEQTTSVEIDKDGRITNVIYEPFDQEYYDITELSDMAANEISEYNVEYSNEKISLEKAELVEDDSFAKLTMNYTSASDYSHFNQVSLFYGTVEEAMDKGYTISNALVNADGENIEGDYIEKHKEKHIVITSDKSNIKTPYNIEYMSKGVTLKDKKEAVLSAVTMDTVQLLLSK